jgi:hypothetical protein
MAESGCDAGAASGRADAGVLDDVERRQAEDLARFGPTTPKRAGRLADASVDHTEARKGEVGTTPVRSERTR